MFPDVLVAGRGWSTGEKAKGSVTRKGLRDTPEGTEIDPGMRL